MARDQEVTMTITGMNSLLNKMNAATRFDVLSGGLYEAALWLTGWSKKYRMSGKSTARKVSIKTQTGLRTVTRHTQTSDHPFLRTISGRLRSSVTATRTVKAGDTYISKIGTNVEYARIHELGGKAGRNRKVTIPARPYLRPALEEPANHRKVLDIINKRIKREFKK